MTNDDGETHRFTQPSYAAVDAMAGYDVNDRWSAQLNVNNIFDKIDHAQALDRAFHGDPLNATVSVSARF